MRTLPRPSRLEGPPATSEASRSSKAVWYGALAALLLGVIAWAVGSGWAAMWLFAAASAGFAVTLPMPYAFVSPLFMGVVAWLVDMLPMIILFGWTVVVCRWVIVLITERRLPRAGRWMWLPAALAVWTVLGFAVAPRAEIKGFLLLLGMQGISSAVMIAVVDQLRDPSARDRLAAGLVAFTVVLSVGVLLQWVGVNIETLQDRSVSTLVEEAYGLDAFPNNIGMIKWARAENSGAGALGKRLESLRQDHPEIPSFRAFKPKFGAYPGRLFVRFAGSARPAEDLLAGAGVRLIFDNVGLAPANTVPRMRSFPRNSLTYAGICAALFPIALAVAWTGSGRRRLLGRLGAAACLFGAAFSLARGAWIALAIGVGYLLVDGFVTRRRKFEAVAIVLIAALVVTVIFVVKYHSDPLNARGGAESSVGTRGSIYADTVLSLKGVHFLIGYGTTQPRSETGTVRAGAAGAKYVPRAGTHSTYLNYAFRAGAPALVMIALIYVLAMAHARAAARSGAGNERMLATLLAAAVVTVAAHAVILSLLVEPAYTLTISLVLGLAVATATANRAPLRSWRRGAPV